MIDRDQNRSGENRPRLQTYLNSGHRRPVARQRRHGGDNGLAVVDERRRVVVLVDDPEHYPGLVER